MEKQDDVRTIQGFHCICFFDEIPVGEADKFKKKCTLYFILMHLVLYIFQYFWSLFMIKIKSWDHSYTGYLIAKCTKYFCSGEGIDFDFC